MCSLIQDILLQYNRYCVDCIFGDVAKLITTNKRRNTGTKGFHSTQKENITNREQSHNPMTDI